MIQAIQANPVVFQAIQWPGYPTAEIQQFCGEKLGSEQREGIAVIGYFIKVGHYINIHRLLSTGDWIIKTKHDGLQVCEKHNFETLYKII